MASKGLQRGEGGSHQADNDSLGCKVDAYKVGPSKPVINGVTTPPK